MTHSQHPPPTDSGDYTPLPGRRPLVLAPGDVFSERFRVERRLASGGVGHVYEAVHIWTTRRVALKLLRPERAYDALLARRFQLEAEAATRVAHPNVAAVIDMGRDSHTGALYLVQEFLQGEDLLAVTTRGRISAAEGMAILAPVMRALQAAHEKGVLHRDLKPENILLARAADGATVPKVIDFGLARLLSGTRRLTDDGTINGTPSYMSPEQIVGDPDLDARTDVWSIAVIWYELLTGELPFPQPRIEALFQSILGDEPAPIRARAPDVPAALAEAVHRGLVKDRSLRFGSMGEFLDALVAALEPAVAREPEAAPAPAPPAEPAPAPTRPESAPRRGGLHLVAGLALGSLLTFALLPRRAARPVASPTVCAQQELHAAPPPAAPGPPAVVPPSSGAAVAPPAPSAPAAPVAEADRGRRRRPSRSSRPRGLTSW